MANDGLHSENPAESPVNCQRKPSLQPVAWVDTVEPYASDACAQACPGSSD